MMILAQFNQYSKTFSKFRYSQWTRIYAQESILAAIDFHVYVDKNSILQLIRIHKSGEK